MSISHGDMETLHTNQTWRHTETHGDTQRHKETHRDMAYKSDMEIHRDTWRHRDTSYKSDMETWRHSIQNPIKNKKIKKPNIISK